MSTDYLVILLFNGLLYAYVTISLYHYISISMKRTRFWMNDWFEEGTRAHPDRLNRTIIKGGNKEGPAISRSGTPLPVTIS
jgi:hypothetical protein